MPLIGDSMKIKSFIKAFVLIAVVAAAVIAFFSYDVLETVEISNDVPHIQHISHAMKNGKTVEITVTDTMEQISDGVYKIKLLIRQNQLRTTADYTVRNMAAVLNLPNDAVILSATCNDANEQFQPQTSQIGNKAKLMCECTSDYLDIEMEVQGLFGFEPTLELSYDIYGRGIRTLSRFMGQHQQLTIDLLADDADAD